MRKKERIKKEVSRIAKQSAKKGNPLNRSKRQELAEELRYAKRPTVTVMDADQPDRVMVHETKGCVRMVYKQIKLKKSIPKKISARP